MLPFAIPTPSKIFAALAVLGLVACLALGVSLEAERATIKSVRGQLALSQSTERNALEANKQAAGTIERMQAVSAAQNTALRDALDRANAAQDRANAAMEKFRNVRRTDPQAQAWADTRLPSAVVGMFPQTADCQSSDGSAPAAASGAVPADASGHCPDKR